MMDKDEMRRRQRLDTKFGIVLQEFRVAQQGVQILFAFLLTLPFQARFTEVNHYQQWIYLAALISAVLSALFFIAPVSQHQLLSGHGMKQTILDSTRHIGQAALLSMLASILSSVYLVVDVVSDYRVAIVFDVLILLVAVLYWYVRPVIWRRQKDED